MKRFKTMMPVVVLALLSPAILLAQPDDKVKEKTKEKKEVQQITITRKGDKNEKVVLEINGDKILLNGKPIEEYKEADVNVMLNNFKDMESVTINRYPGARGGSVFRTDGQPFAMTTDTKRAMLGVTTDGDEKGARVTDVTDESAAEKIGLKEDDIITKIDDKEIKNPDDLSAAISKHKPGDKVTVQWLRDKKEQKATAELSKWKGMTGFSTTSPRVQGYRVERDGMSPALPNIPGLEGLERFKVFEAPMGQGWSWNGNGPKLGLSVQDTDEGKGVKVIEVDEESNAGKAGLKEEDIITEIDGKAVNSTDETVKIIRESKEKTSIMVKLLRGGKTMNIEVRMPRKIKTADL